MDQLRIDWGSPVRVRVGRGPMATEHLLLEDLDELLNKLGASVLERPIYVVVPSKSLRLHVQRQLLLHRRRGLAGVACQTHHSLAAQLVEKAGLATDSGPDLFALFARRFASQEPALARSLDHLSDGYRTVLTAVRDLMDAGLDPAHHEALEEVLNAEGFAVAGKSDIGRAHAIVRVAVRTASAMRELNLERSSTLLTRATEVVRDRIARPVAAVLVYGYSDATGLAIDFLQALLEVFGGLLYLDRPPDPANPEQTDLGKLFSRNFTERLLSSFPEQPAEAADAEPSRVAMFKALGGDAEVREVGSRIRDLLDSGVEPESIGVVARTLQPYRESIRTQFHRLGLPFSGVGAQGPRHPVAYRASAVLDLLRLQARAPVERWLEARDPNSLSAPDFDLRLAFHSLGAGRLEEAASIRPSEVTERGSLELPVCSGLAVAAMEDAERTPRRFARKRRILQEALSAEVLRAQELVHLLDANRQSRPIRTHLEKLTALLGKSLGWDPRESVTVELIDSVKRAVRGLSPEFPLTDDEFLELLREAFSQFGATLLGGKGGGVQVLDVIEARSRTFDHLFVLGLNRGRFPRPVHEDPVLPDSLRRVLARSGFGVLPDLALKRHGFSEERFLFAQLLAASPSVTLSWQEVDDEHAFQTTSPLVERLRWSSRRQGDPSWKSPPTAQALFSTAPTSDERKGLRTAYESAVLVGMFGERNKKGFRDLLGLALEESQEFDARVRSPATISDLRIRILEEVDPAHGTATGNAARARLGPYFGYVGPVASLEDPRGKERVFITTLERLASCPWQGFIRKVLAIEPHADPLELLPSIEPRVLGNLVHEVLERIVTGAVGPAPESLHEARLQPATRIPWPEADELERLLRSAATDIVRREGIALPGFDRVLARFARVYLESAQTLDWPDGESRHPIVAAEYWSNLEWPEAQTRIGFRADRLDQLEAGLAMTDYKTGRSLFGEGQSAPSVKKLRQSMLTGRALQAMAYAMAAGEPKDRGRYLFLKPEIAESKGSDVELSAEDPEVTAAFRQTVNATLAVWQRGTFFPRLSVPTENAEPDACRYCDVAEACLRGDSGSRGRLRAWSDSQDESGLAELDPTSTSHSIATLWFLPSSNEDRR